MSMADINECPSDCQGLIPRREPRPMYERPPKTLSQVFYETAYKLMTPKRIHETRGPGIGKLIAAMIQARGFDRCR